MTHMRLKLAAAGVILAGAVAYLTVLALQNGTTYSLGVDQYMASPERQAQRVQLRGQVSEENLKIQRGQLTASFLLKGEKQSLPVIYHGVVPDMLKANVEVIVEGKRDATGAFNADTLITKCASKYDEMPKGHPPVATMPDQGVAP
jgi:cytochrome c-type biogenesis protein CcmE